MGGTSKLAYALALVLATAISVAGCGDGGSSTATSDGGDTVTRAGGVQSDAGPGDGFVVPGGDNSIQRFGREAPPAERKAASEVLESYMRARASEQFVEECIYLARTAVEPLEKLAPSAPSAPRGCVVALSALGTGASTGSDAMIGPVGSLRIGEGRAFALYHGRGGVDYVMPMVKEGGAWKVASLAPIEL